MVWQIKIMDATHHVLKNIIQEATTWSHAVKPPSGGQSMIVLDSLASSESDLLKTVFSLPASTSSSLEGFMTLRWPACEGRCEIEVYEVFHKDLYSRADGGITERHIASLIHAEANFISVAATDGVARL